LQVVVVVELQLVVFMVAVAVVLEAIELVLD